MGVDDDGDEPVAAVLYDAPHGIDGLLISAALGPVVAFGRGGGCAIRFGYAPHVDTRLARRAGGFVVAAGRLAVESSSDATHAPLQVRAPGRPPVELARGELYSPGTDEFRVVVRGDRDWTMEVKVARRAEPATGAPPSDDPTTRDWVLDLTDHERALLVAYAAPLRAGHLEPATHAAVAEGLLFSVSKVRHDLYAVWAKMIAAGLPVPDYSDKRRAVTYAALMTGMF